MIVIKRPSKSEEAASREALRRRAASWASRSGAPIRWNGQFNVRWDGRALCLSSGYKRGSTYARLSRLPGERIIHEVNHWLLAPPWRKKLPNYGLGDSIGDSAAARISESRRANEEMAVTLLDAEVLLRFGAGYMLVRDWVTETISNPNNLLTAARSLGERAV